MLFFCSAALKYCYTVRDFGPLPTTYAAAEIVFESTRATKVTKIECDLKGLRKSIL